MPAAVAPLLEHLATRKLRVALGDQALQMLNVSGLAVERGQPFASQTIEPNRLAGLRGVARELRFIAIGEQRHRGQQRGQRALGLRGEDDKIHRLGRSRRSDARVIPFPKLRRFRA